MEVLGGRSSVKRNRVDPVVFTLKDEDAGKVYCKSLEVTKGGSHRSLFPYTCLYAM